MTIQTRLGGSARRVTRHFRYTSTLQLKRVTTGALSSSRGASQTVTAVTVACTQPTPFAHSLVDGTTVLEGDLRVYVLAADPALTFVPKAGDVAILDADSYAVVGVERQVGAYEIHLRGGGA